MSPPDPRTTANSDLPQCATQGDSTITELDWFFEPCWKGVRLLARLEDGRVRLTDEHGIPAGPEMDEAARVLQDAIDANQALIDGSWTAMPFTGVGSQARERAKAMAGEVGKTPPHAASFETRRAFVAWDLVELDGQLLHDIPYQERRRLLESVILEGTRVRISLSVRQPIRGWLEAWRSDGFTHYVAKHANSRYRPGETAPDWLQMSVLTDGQPSILERIFGSPRRRVPDASHRES